MNIVEIIQIMLVPGLMVSGCGLLLLSQNNKYSNVINRVRQLDDEKRKLLAAEQQKPLNELEKNRIKSINTQNHQLGKRIRYVRNTVLAYTIAVGFFIFTCLGVGLQVAIKQYDISGLVLGSFLCGMACILSGVIFGIKETRIGYQIISIEIYDEKQ